MLSQTMEPLSGQALDDNAISLSEPSSPWLTPPMPPNQMAYQEWLLTAATSIFRCECLPDSPLFTLDAPSVKGLVIYAARCGSVKFYAAWVETTGTFVGWLKVRPAIEGVDSDFGVGEVFGKPLDSKISMDSKGHLAIDRFVRELGKVAWAIGPVEE
jgi:hypothetical protein